MTTKVTAAETAADKLEAFFFSLSPDEQAELAPVIFTGLDRLYEAFPDEVQGFAICPPCPATKPRIMDYMNPSRMPTVVHAAPAPQMTQRPPGV
jgi:hypothetical protein